jgi:hypothetical protein
MAVFLFLLAVIGAVVVGDLVLENPAAGEVTVFNQAVTGHGEGILLAMAAALGFLVAMLLVASVGSTTARRARRKQLRGVTAGVHHHLAEPGPDRASLLDEFFNRQAVVGDPGAPVRPTDLRHQTEDRPDRPIQ